MKHPVLACPKAKSPVARMILAAGTISLLSIAFVSTGRAQLVHTPSIVLRIVDPDRPPAARDGTELRIHIASESTPAETTSARRDRPAKLAAGEPRLFAAEPAVKLRPCPAAAGTSQASQNAPDHQPAPQLRFKSAPKPVSMAANNREPRTAALDRSPSGGRLVSHQFKPSKRLGDPERRPFVARPLPETDALERSGR